MRKFAPKRTILTSGFRHMIAAALFALVSITVGLSGTAAHAAQADGFVVAQAYPGQPAYQTRPAYQPPVAEENQQTVVPSDPRRSNFTAQPQAMAPAQQEQQQMAPAPQQQAAPAPQQQHQMQQTQPQQPAYAVPQYQNNPAYSGDEYVLGIGDRLKVNVFGEEDLSGEFEIDGNGRIFMPLVGAVNVGGQTLHGAQNQIITILHPDYLKNPKVSVEVTNYRDFYILGEVNEPGNFPFKSGLTVINAIALAGGYTGRASKNSITVVKAGDTSQKERKIGLEDVIQPGDILRVKERLF